MKNKIINILNQSSVYGKVSENVFEDVAEEILAEIKTYKEDLRLAYKQGAKDFSESLKPLATFLNEDVDNYIESLEPKVEEETVSFTYSFLRRKIEWENFCDITGIDYYATRNGFEIKDHETFEIKESVAKQYGLL